MGSLGICILKLVLIFFNDPWELCYLHANPPEFISDSPGVVLACCVVTPLVEFPPDVRVYFTFFQKYSLLGRSGSAIKGFDCVLELLINTMLLPR